MPDLLTLIVFPLIVAVFALVVEYWVIQPLRNRQMSGKEDLTDSTGKFSFVELIKNLFLFSGLVAFLFSIFIILGGLKSDQISFGGMLINVPISSLLTNSILSDVNISFATILYTCITLNTLAFYKNSPDWIGVFTLIILPPVLLLLWASVFLWENWFIFFICWLISNFWLIGGLLLIVEKNKTPIGVLSLFLFPTNALILIFVATYYSSSAWGLALMILLIHLYMVNSKTIKEE